MTVSLIKEEIGKVQPKSSFQRYQIPTREIPHRYPVPHPFIPKVNKIGLAKILISEVFEYNFKLFKSTYRSTLFSRPCIYGVFGGPLGGFIPIIEKCTGCLRCVQEFPDVCTVDRNPDFTLFADSYWSAEDPTKVSDSPFATVWYEAETGKILVKGMGYKGFFASEGWDAMWTDMSEIVRPTRDGVYGREFISTQVDIGARKSRVTFPIVPFNPSKVVSVPIPIIFDYLPDNLLSESIVASIVNSALTTETKYIFKPEQIDRYNIPVDNNLFLYIDKTNFSKMGTHLTVAAAVIIDNSSLELLYRLRDIRQDLPILMRIPFTDTTYEDIINAIDLKIDGFILYADYHGENQEQTHFIKDMINDVHTKLVKDGLRDKVTLIGSGGIILAEHIPKAIIMGVDAVAINTSILVALQVKFEGNCKIPSMGIISDTKFNAKWGGQRLTNLLGSWHNQLIEIMSAMGIKEVRRLRGDTGRAMFNDELEEEAFGDIARID